MRTIIRYSLIKANQMEPIPIQRFVPSLITSEITLSLGIKK